MKLSNLGNAEMVSSPPDLTDEEKTAILASYDAQFDSVEAEKEYRAMIDKGGVSWEHLMEKLDEIDKKSQPRSA
jgi:hypothetical protein